jgi:3-methyladenine DNA glycosylase/8-oxoguanine DNA glycosylase
VTELQSTGDEAVSRSQIEVASEVVPRGPYSLALSARGSTDSCRRFRGGALTALFDLDGHLEIAEARQLPNGVVSLRAASDRGIDLLRFELALDDVDDHSIFLERFGGDPLLGPSTRALRGLRPVRLATVAHALLRALCGQLITAREARAIERRVIHRVSCRDSDSGLLAPPTQAQLAALAPAELCRLGLAPKRAAALVRICRTLDLERLRRLPPDSVFARLERERTIGPWSLGVIGLEGLGAYSRGLSGDLQLMKLCAVLEGRWVSEAETGALLDRYGEWAGLASVYLLRGSRRGLVPLGSGAAGVEIGARAVRARSRRDAVSTVSGATPAPAD